MMTISVNTTSAGSTSPEQLDRVSRLHFNNPKERQAHIQAFLAWLPPILKTAPGICWERLPSGVMGYLIRAADMPEVVAITLAVGCAMDAMKPKTLYMYCTSVTNLLRRLRKTYGMVTLADLAERRVWDAFVEGRLISSGDLNMLRRYQTLACVYQRLYFENLPERQQVIWKPYLLPRLPRGFCVKQAQQQAVIAAREARRKEQSDIIVPLFPLLVELVQLRKQAAERLVKEFRRLCALAARGEITLPYRFEYVDRQFSVSEQAMTLSEVQLVEQPVTLKLSLWNRTELVKHHPKLYTKEVRRRVKRQMGAYAPLRNGYFLQYEGEARHLLWCGALIEKHLLGATHHPEVIGTRRPGVLTSTNADAQWIGWARRRTGAILFDPEPLYRGALFAAALATLALTNGSRVSELLQVSSSRFETIVVDELKNQQLTGRKIGVLVQKLLPKGYQHESERQFFLISDMAVRHLKEIAELLQAAHGGRIPIVSPEAFGNKADDLVAEPYFFQWAATPDGRLGHFNAQDVAQLLRFLFHGLTLTTKAGEPIRIAPHLLRHVLATHARTALNIPAEAIAYLLHHRVKLEGTSRALTIPEATAYYSRLPVAQLLALLFEIQPQLASDPGRSYLQAPSPQTLEQMDEALRKQFERCGMIGPTVLGFCSAGTCVRPSNRGICANCQYLVPHYSNLLKAKTWRRLYVLQAKLHDDQGHAVDAEQARKMVQYIDDAIRIMEIQIRTRQDGGYLPFADTLPPAQEDDGDER
jgi:aryl carrier-like protein